MEVMQLREREIVRTLKAITQIHFVVIGGYAVNCYTKPRFSIDCDIVVNDRKELNKIEEQLRKLGYTEEESAKKHPIMALFSGMKKKFLKIMLSALIFLLKK
jgi:hypothetical protein